MNIIIDRDGRSATVDKAAYITAKTKQLREFGYPELTEDEVAKELEGLLAGKQWTTVIGGFVESDKPRNAEAIAGKPVKRAKKRKGK